MTSSPTCDQETFVAEDKSSQDPGSTNVRRISPEIPNEKNVGQNRGGGVPRISSARVRPGRRRPAGQVRVRRCASNSLSRSVRLKASCVQHGRRARIFLTPARARLSLRSSRLSPRWQVGPLTSANRSTSARLDGLVSRRSLVSARRTVDGPSSLVFTSPRNRKDVRRSAHTRGRRVEAAGSPRLAAVCSNSWREAVK